MAVFNDVVKDPGLFKDAVSDFTNCAETLREKALFPPYYKWQVFQSRRRLRKAVQNAFPSRKPWASISTEQLLNTIEKQDEKDPSYFTAMCLHELTHRIPALQEQDKLHKAQDLG
ncbi:MAG: hypothetical protein OXT65_04830 [Alphaproteobacteria bacterium]|nr:hypothetical protein [Alphaproteobacteria bacterium]